jgi:hypothetical protein
MLDETWRDEGERLWRSFVDLREVMEDTATSERIAATDPLRQFCRHAFELRDWLLAAPDVDPAAKAAIRQLFGSPNSNPAKRVAAMSFALAACADIANRTKHFELTRPSYSEGGYAEIVGESMSSQSDIPEVFRALISGGDVPRLNGEHQWQWWVKINGEIHDALMLAERAIDDWTACLVSVGMVRFSLNGWIYLCADGRWTYWSERSSGWVIVEPDPGEVNG